MVRQDRQPGNQVKGRIRIDLGNLAMSMAGSCDNRNLAAEFEKMKGMVEIKYGKKGSRLAMMTQESSCCRNQIVVRGK